MRVYVSEDSRPFCGHWNGSPIEIGMTELLYTLPISETLHYHDYYEYYVVLQGEGKLNVEGRHIELVANTVIMMEPFEKHEVTFINPDQGLQCLIVKQKSLPNGKVIERKNKTE